MAVISNNNIFSSTPFPPLVDPTLALISLRDPKLYLFKVPLFVAPPKEKKTPRHLCAKVYFTLNEPFSSFSSLSHLSHLQVFTCFVLDSFQQMLSRSCFTMRWLLHFKSQTCLYLLSSLLYFFLKFFCVTQNKDAKLYNNKSCGLDLSWI